MTTAITLLPAAKRERLSKRYSARNYFRSINGSPAAVAVHRCRAPLLAERGTAQKLMVTIETLGNFVGAKKIHGYRNDSSIASVKPQPAVLLNETKIGSRNSLNGFEFCGRSDLKADPKFDFCQGPYACCGSAASDLAKSHCVKRDFNLYNRVSVRRQLPTMPQLNSISSIAL